MNKEKHKCEVCQDTGRVYQSPPTWTCCHSCYGVTFLDSPEKEQEMNKESPKCVYCGTGIVVNSDTHQRRMNDKKKYGGDLIHYACWLERKTAREAVNQCGRCGKSKVFSFVADICTCEKEKEQEMLVDPDSLPAGPERLDAMMQLHLRTIEELPEDKPESIIEWDFTHSRVGDVEETKITGRHVVDTTDEVEHLKEVCGRLTAESKHYRNRDKRQRKTIGKLKEVDKKAQLKIRRQAAHITVQDAKIVKLKEFREYAKKANKGLMQDILAKGYKIANLKTQIQEGLKWKVCWLENLEKYKAYESMRQEITDLHTEIDRLHQEKGKLKKLVDRYMEWVMEAPVDLTIYQDVDMTIGFHDYNG